MAMKGTPPPVADPQVTSDAGTRDGNGRFKPGHTGNPGGRPSSTAREFHDRAMKLLRAKGEDGVEEAERLIQGLIRLGVEGNVQAAKLILDRVWPATNVIDATVTDGITAEEGRDTLAAWRRQFVSTGEIPEL